MKKRSTSTTRTPKSNVPPWLDSWQPRRDFAEGRTMGLDWDRLDCHDADMAVRSGRERRVIDREWASACRVVSAMGLLVFNMRYIHARWSGSHLVDLED